MAQVRNVGFHSQTRGKNSFVVSWKSKRCSQNKRL